MAHPLLHSTQMSKASLRTKRHIYTVFGLISLVLVILGIILPVIPGVPFALAAAFFLTRGNRKFYFWLMEFKAFRKPIRDWQKYNVIRPKTKFFFLAMVWMSVISFFVFNETSLLGRIITLSLFVAAAVWAFLQPSKAKRKPRRTDIIDISQFKKKIAHAPKSARR